MRSMWNGQIVFGMVAVPVKVYGATEDHDPEFKQVHVEDAGKIRFQRVCEVCGPVDYSEIGRGYTNDKGEVIVLTQKQLDEVTAKNDQMIKVSEFVPADQVDPLLFDKSYYVGPGAAGSKPYAVLRAALQKTNRLALVRVTFRTSESLAVLRVQGQAIVLQTLLWPDEVRKPDQVTGLMAVASPDADDATVAMAVDLIEAMAGDFQPELYTDQHAALLRGLIAKLEAIGAAKPIPEPAVTEEETGAALLAQLEASVGAAKSD